MANVEKDGYGLFGGRRATFARWAALHSVMWRGLQPASIHNIMDGEAASLPATGGVDNLNSPQTRHGESIDAANHFF